MWLHASQRQTSRQIYAMFQQTLWHYTSISRKLKLQTSLATNVKSTPHLPCRKSMAVHSKRQHPISWVCIAHTSTSHHCRQNYRILHRPNTRTARRRPRPSIFGTMDQVQIWARHVVTTLRTTGNRGSDKIGGQTWVEFTAFFKRIYASVRVSLLLPGFLTTIRWLVTHTVTCLSVEYTRMS
jgi:hypothetical protein